MSAADTAQAVEIADEEFGGNKRSLLPFENRLFAVLCVGFTLFHLFVLNFYTLEPLMFRAIHVGWGAAIGFMLYTPLKQAAKAGVPWYDWIMVALSVASAAYVVVEIDGLLFRAGAMWTPWDVVVGIVGTLLILEFTRRAAGLALPIIACVFILYAFIGAWMPGVLNHKGFAPDRFFTYIYSEYGIFSVTTAVSSTYIVLFVTFAAFLQVSKVGDYVNDLCNALFGWARGGPAKAAVASGIMFGSISGSSVGNVVASGMVTIPMMRKVGYDRPTAAAIEATSSTGGQITPPVMGAGAFLMAEITGIPYSEIALAAVIPCLLFYIACWIHVDLHAIRLGLRGLTRDELPELGRMLKLLFLFSPIVALIAALVMGYSPFRAGAVGILAGMFSGWIWRLLPRMVPDRPGGAAAIVRDVVLSNGLAVIIGLVAGFGGFWLLGKVAALLPVWGTLFAALIGVALLATAFGWRATGEALALSARDCVQLVAVCACAGIIVGVIALTGIGGRFAQLILDVAGESHLLAMIFAGMLALILGMGMPTTAAYAIAASVIAPGLAKIGVPVLTAHLFIFYFAVISAITPPVALASFAAAGMAQADPWKTSWIALKMGLATFLVPFMFYYSPVLLMKGDAPAIGQALVSASIGVWFLAGATENSFGGSLAMPLRIALFAAAICLLHPGGASDLIGFAIGVPIYLWQRLRRRETG